MRYIQMRRRQNDRDLDLDIGDDAHLAYSACLAASF